MSNVRRLTITRVEMLHSGCGLPLELPPAMGGHAGVPTSVAKAAALLKPSDLLCWNDDHSHTFGIARFNKTVVLERKSVAGLSIDLMHPAKGRGWVALEARLKEQPTPVTLLQSLAYNAEAVNWLFARKEQLESVFGVAIEVRDHGSDY